eukprot:1736669-Rhodomonas_salina.2
MPACDRVPVRQGRGVRFSRHILACFVVLQWGQSHAFFQSERSAPGLIAMGYAGGGDTEREHRPARMHGSNNGAPKLYRGRNARRRDTLKQMKELDGQKGNTAKKFVPTSQWQRVQPGQAVPRGLDIRMDMQGGGTFAKLPGGAPGRQRGWFAGGFPPNWALWGAGLGAGAAAVGAGVIGVRRASIGVLATPFRNRVIAPLILGYLGAVNVWSAGVVVQDKRSAMMGEWRVPERSGGFGRLIELALAGGWVCGSIAMAVSHHKTQKGSFLAPYAAASAANAGLTAVVLRLPPVRLSFAVLFGLSGL